MSDNVYHVIKDPVHDTMQLTTLEDGWVKPFIDSPNFQRLRHIKQLGMGDFIFPGAVHTRFNHCLGCCYVASQIAHKIGLAEEERQLVMIACLLHDIGHGPFSHTFEELFNNKLIHHEDWTPFFLAEYRSEAFFNQYNRRNPRHHLTDEKFQLIEDMIMHRLTSKKVLADIVSSQLDADRLDYLLRDSHFCGVSYGEFDLRWMLHCMTIVNSGQGERLGITHKGIGVVEHYLVARRLMTRNIYHYQKKIALENLLVQLLKNLAENLNHSLFTEIKKSRLGKFLEVVNEFNGRNDAGLKNEFLKNNYALYKELADYDIFSLIHLLANFSENLPAIQIAKRIQNRVMPKIIRVDHLDYAKTQALIADFKNAHKNTLDDWQLMLVKTPHQSYKINNDPILVLTEQDQVKPINEISLMISGISDKHEQAAFLCVDKAVFLEERIQQLIKKLIKI
jgi:HD superfamily phosphohydrolase